MKNTKKVTIDSLALEVTRKCNANCAHCLRGNAENKNTNKKVIRQLFKNIKHIQCITFTGGEPTLYTRALRDTLNICKEYGIEVDYVYVVTNGIRYSRRLVNVMNDWMQYCMETMGYDFESYRDREFYLGDGLFGLSLSIDAFHPRMAEDSWKYKDLPYYNSCKEHNPKESFIGIIREGRAENNNSFAKNSRVLRDYEFSFSFYDDEEEIPEMVYCNVNGEIFPSCDMSFERQRNIANNENVNIFERSLYDIIHDEEIDYANVSSINIA